jgi:CO/xanthine dehydrogenase Mo-binding subunit
LNAIADAIGQRIYHLPANLERVLEAVQKSKEKA